MKTEILRMEHITKSRAGVKILDDFRLNIYKGEVLGLIGLSGTGKTAISNILSGCETVDDGRIYFDEQQTLPHNKNARRRNNIFIIHHTSRLVPQLSIAENIFVIKDNSFRKIMVDRKAINQQANVLLREVGLEISPETPAGELSIAKQHLVELAKGISDSTRLIILDEITEFYTFKELCILKETINRLKKKGIAFLFETCKPDELMDFADRIAVLRDGKNVKTLHNGEYSKDLMQSLMVGSEFREHFDREDTITDKMVLRLERLYTEKIEGLSFNLHRGEILGILDLEGKASIEVYNLLTGRVQPKSGNIYLDGSRIQIKNIIQTVRSGIGIVPEGGIYSSLFENMNFIENISFLVMEKMSGFFLNINKKIYDFIAKEYSNVLGLNDEDRYIPVQSFDVFIRQKIMLYRWLLFRPQVLVFANLGAMLDVVTKKVSYAFINEAAKNGIGILMVTSDISEAANICDRVIVISGKRVRGEYTKGEITRLRINELCY